MKKLQNKVFGVIFLLLTTFTFFIFLFSTTKLYIEKQRSVSDMLIKVPRIYERFSNFSSDFIPREDLRGIYLDSTIYTVILDSNGNYKELINHTFDDEVDDVKIKKIATNIINNHKDEIYVGNLYTNKYAYMFTPNNTLVIMDNSNINASLFSQSLFNLFLFIIAEIIIIVITSLITKWIITPVKNSFMKQKTFVSDASHELKTPLSVMVASCDAYFNDKDEKWIYNMKNESERMIKLVTELLDLAKTEETEVNYKKNNLSEIIEGSILTFESLFYEKNIKLKYEILDGIEFMCNENLITELVSILVDNAIRHTSKHGKVFVNLSKKNKQIILEVKNKGVPISKEDETRIFERFYKVDSSRNRNSNNYGLGLAIAKNIVELHNGVISAHSEDGYTTFKVIFNQK